MAACKVEMVPVDGAKPEAVFRRYFDRRAPFDEDKSKAEFPDAFVLEALSAWANARNRRVYVVTGDNAVRRACDDNPCLVPLGGLDELLDLVVAEEGRLAQFAIDSFQRRFGAIGAAIGDFFEELNFHLTDEPDAEINEVSVDDVLLVDSHLVDLEDELVATFDLTVEIKFSAQIAYQDPDTGVWDPEERRWLFRQMSVKRGPRRVVVPAEVEVRFDQDDPNVLEIKTVAVNWGQDVEVPFHGDDEWL